MSAWELARIGNFTSFSLRSGFIAEMFWKSIETIKEQTLQQIVKDPNTSLDDVLNHDYCFQELRVESPYLVE